MTGVISFSDSLPKVANYPTLISWVANFNNTLVFRDAVTGARIDSPAFNSSLGAHGWDGDAAIVETYDVGANFDLSSDDSNYLINCVYGGIGGQVFMCGFNDAGTISFSDTTITIPNTLFSIILDNAASATSVSHVAMRTGEVRWRSEVDGVLKESYDSGLSLPGNKIASLAAFSCLSVPVFNGYFVFKFSGDVPDDYAEGVAEMTANMIAGIHRLPARCETWI